MSLALTNENPYFYLLTSGKHQSKDIQREYKYRISVLMHRKMIMK